MFSSFRFYRSKIVNKASEQLKSSRFIWGGAALAGVSAGAVILYYAPPPRIAWSTTSVFAASVQPSSLRSVGQQRPDLPTYRADQVKAHSTPDKRIWVTFRNGVYDITDFISQHPGGTEKIMLAAGDNLDPYWQVYTQHLSETVGSILEPYRIGNLHPDDVANKQATKVDSVYRHEPIRSPLLRVNSAQPMNAEPHANLLVDSFFTPNQIFYVRNHLPVPDVSGATDKTWKLELSNGRKTKSLSVADLRRMKSSTVTTAIQCAGNRRTGMGKEKKVMGLGWDVAAVGNAQFTGVPLADVLRSVFGEAALSEAKHVVLTGADADQQGTSYEASIPLSLALDPRRRVMLAFDMNGEPLPIDHGYPLRCVVPGVCGARQVKWLRSVRLSPTESDSHWTKQDYKVFPNDVTAATVDWSAAPPILDMPVQSAICTPLDGATISTSDGFLTVKGYATSGNGASIASVDVSLDGGRTWTMADLDRGTSDDDDAAAAVWAWTLWEAHLDLPDPCPPSLTILVKARDSSCNTQPRHADDVWNFRGLLNNSWHRVDVKCSG